MSLARSLFGLGRKKQPYRRGPRLRVEQLEDRWVPTSANQNFVAHIYVDVLHRAAEPAGSSGWVALLDQGAVTRIQVAQAFLGSAEYRNLVVDEAYSLLLKRSASPA